MPEKLRSPLSVEQATIRNLRAEIATDLLDLAADINAGVEAYNQWLFEMECADV